MEVVVALLVGVNVLYVLYTLFTQDQRRWAVDQGRLGSLAGIMLFAEHLEADVRQVALYFPDARHTEFNLDRPVRIDDGRRRLTLVTFQGTAPDETSVPVRSVVWAFDPRTTSVTRNGDPLRALAAEEVVFDLLGMVADLGPARLAALGVSTPLVLYNAQLPIHVLKVQVTAVPESSRTEPAERREQKRVSMVFALPLLYRSDRVNRPYWNASPGELLGEP